jgi:hypothetical protein
MPGLKEALPQVTILVIAHTDKRGVDLFGSIAQFANCDLLYMLERDGRELKATLTCKGARDIEEPNDLTIGLEEESIETAKGAEKNLVITKELTILDKTGEEAGRDEALAKPVLLELDGAGFTQWYEKVKARRQGKYSSATHNSVVQHLCKGGEIVKVNESKTWVDDKGKERVTKGIWRVVEEQVVAVVREGRSMRDTSLHASLCALSPKGDKASKAKATDFKVALKQQSNTTPDGNGQRANAVAKEDLGDIRKQLIEESDRLAGVPKAPQQRNEGEAQPDDPVQRIENQRALFLERIRQLEQQKEQRRLSHSEQRDLECLQFYESELAKAVAREHAAKPQDRNRKP